MEQNNNHHEYLWHLLANPADTNELYAEYLQGLVNQYPQSGLFRALVARTGEREKVKSALAYLDNKVLFNIVKYPGGLSEVDANEIIFQSSATSKADNNWSDYSSDAPAEVQSNTLTSLLEDQKERFDLGLLTSNFIGDQQPVNEAAELIAQDDEVTLAAISVTEEVEEDVNDRVTSETEETAAAPNLVFEELAPWEQYETNAAKEDNEISKQHTEPLAVGVADGAQEPSSASVEQGTVNEIVPHEIEDEIFDEIVGIEHIHFEPISTANDEPQITNDVTVTEGARDMDVEEEKLIVGNIAATDYFIFEQAFGEGKKTDEADDAGTEQTNEPAVERPVTRYHDEKMPYTFLWWLDKMRREHAGIYQPYVSSKAPAFKPEIMKKGKADALEQQYVENIFHLTSVEDLVRNTIEAPEQPEVKRKEDEIIEKFIQHEPQIRPPSSDRLDNENKARKSAEDADELVTETLARIYSEQMLYHKAIATYKKLKLKFPEKSGYFEAQIEMLERKIN